MATYEESTGRLYLGPGPLVERATFAISPAAVALAVALAVAICALIIFE